MAYHYVAFLFDIIINWRRLILSFSCCYTPSCNLPVLYVVDCTGFVVDFVASNVVLTDTCGVADVDGTGPVETINISAQVYF